MKHIFLLRFSGGACGDVLTSLISEDSNFYSVETKEGPNNVWNIVPRFGYNLHLKEIEFPIISDEIRDDVDRSCSEKHLILGTHCWYRNIMDINLPRMRVVRLVSSGYMTSLFYFLLWIKRHSVKSTDFTYINHYRNIEPYPEKARKYEKIDKNGYFRGVDRACFRLKIDPHINSVNEFFNDYYVQSEAIIPAYLGKEDIRLDVGKFFNNTEIEAPIWERAFDMAGKLDIDRIRAYHEKDLALFESCLGRPPNAYNDREDFLKDLKAYISKIAPDLCE